MELNDKRTAVISCHLIAPEGVYQFSIILSNLFTLYFIKVLEIMNIYIISPNKYWLEKYLDNIYNSWYLYNSYSGLLHDVCYLLLPEACRKSTRNQVLQVQTLFIYTLGVAVEFYSLGYHLKISYNTCYP